MKIAVLLVISCFIAAAYSESIKAPQFEDDDDNTDLSAMDAEPESKFDEMTINEDICKTTEVQGTSRYFWTDYCRCKRYIHGRCRCRVYRYRIVCSAPRKNICYCRLRC
ncbi:PREDICTED: uncharacterized protein LOC109583333 isoform X2 [Amphimedon queenslandica]|uniref:Invertebrate defensins family profile domain-containing protein n=1 Tax=Amphimedon queenslandica TaxID=400682 RepID=A0AAN0JBV5_AMPQE|nr:PREDICTED: uncharacterized protein LOC109583333 isoform X2 [Amphimedon queenslandica]|eukprot:XP_019854183.1 PREDICTED: uncharacterized protein LOC109583333 isoform X2 [Amphimedon queenslandica]